MEIERKNGVDSLKPAGHGRREQLSKRLDNLQQAAELVSKQAEVYAVDPAKLKEDPDIMRHFNFHDHAFTVTNPKKGYVYYWERNDSRSISWRKGQARMFIGPKSRGWEVVSGHDGQCTGGRNCECEATELIHTDGTRTIGDVLLMRIELDSYILIQKRLALMNKFRESNVAQKLSDFVRENEGLVQVHNIVGENPRQYFARKGVNLEHTGTQEASFPSLDDLAASAGDNNEG